MSPELPWIFPSLSLALHSNSFSLVFSTSPFLHPCTVWYSREIVPPTRASLLFFFHSNPSPSLSVSLSPRTMFRRTVETNRLIRSNVRRPRRLSLKDTIDPFSSPPSSLLSFPFFSLRDPANWLRTNWTSGGELHRDERADFERASPNVQCDFSSFPIGRQTHSRLNILKTTGFAAIPSSNLQSFIIKLAISLTFL